MVNNIKAGDHVICISEDFPHIKEFGGTDTNRKPKLNEVLIVDEVLGVFLRFDEYDTDLDHHWFHFNRFKKIDGTIKVKRENGNIMYMGSEENEVKGLDDILTIFNE